MSRLVTFLCLMLCLGCAKREPIIGSVVDKTWIPAHTSTDIVPMQIGDATIYMPVDNRVPDEFVLSVKTELGNTYYMRVNKQTYDSYTLRQQYPHYEVPQ